MSSRAFIAALGGAASSPIIFASTLLCIAAIWPSRVEAHDIYVTLKDSYGRTCCSGRDCRPAHYRAMATGIEMLVDGQWIVVPDETIQYRSLEGDTGETAGGHWCGLLDQAVTYCAILPPSSAYSVNEEAVPHSAYEVIK